MELESGGDIQALMGKLRRDSDEKRNNCVHAVYTSVYLKENAEEYKTHLELNKTKGANSYGDLYADANWFTKA